MISANLAQRLAVAAIAIPAMLFLVFLGGDFFLLLVLLLAALGMYEFLAAASIRFPSPFFLLPFFLTVSAVFLTATTRNGLGWACLTALFIILGILSVLTKDDPERLFSRLTYIVWGAGYIGVLYPFVYLIRGESGWMVPAPGRWWLFFLLGSLWLGDTAAMFFGSRFGEKKLAPTISPGKTVVGFWGCFFGTVAVAVLFKLLWLKDVSLIHLLVMAIAIGLVGQGGDLVESLWKRARGRKDSSTLIPGHGGVLDRFDSLLFAAPVLYFYLKVIVRAAWL